MKIESITEVKKRFTQIVRELPQTGMVVVTKDGRPTAIVMQASEDTDLEVLALSANKRFWRLWDRASRHKTTALDDIPVQRDEALARRVVMQAGGISESSTEYRAGVGKARTRKPKRAR